MDEEAEGGRQSGSEKVSTPTDGKREGMEEKPKSLKAEIEEKGFNPEGIKNIAEEIAKEASYSDMDLAYISKKVSELGRFISNIEKPRQYLRGRPRGVKLGDVITDAEGKHEVVAILSGSSQVLCVGVNQ